MFSYWCFVIEWFAIYFLMPFSNLPFLFLLINTYHLPYFIPILLPFVRLLFLESSSNCSFPFSPTLPSLQPISYLLCHLTSPPPFLFTVSSCHNFSPLFVAPQMSLSFLIYFHLISSFKNYPSSVILFSFPRPFHLVLILPVPLPQRFTPHK